MDGLLSFLLLAGLFYFMMRFGCGSHIAHGHSSHSHDNREIDQSTKYVDPVCGMEVDVDKGYGKMHSGKLYRFCSRNCLDKFDIEPVLYLETKGEKQ